MPHPLVAQLRFTRSEWRRALAGVSDEDARRRFQPMNCISWIVGHLAWQENLYWMIRAQEKNAAPHLNDLVGFGMPASTPPLDEMWAAWRAVTEAADPYLDELTARKLTDHMVVDGRRAVDNIGTNLQRVIYHYWYHTGEAMAIRQMLGHPNLAQFVGNIGRLAPYRLGVA